MNDRPIQDDQDDLAGFETYEGDIHDDAPLDDTIADADFQDVQDDIDPEVFGEEEPAPAPKKKTNWFNIGVAACAILVAGGLVFSKLGPQLMGGADEQPSMAASGAMSGDVTGEQLANTNAGDSQASIAQALGQNAAPAAAQSGGVLDNPEGYAELAQMPAPDAPAPVKTEAAPDPFAGLPAPAAATPVPDTNAVSMPVADTSAVPMPAPIAAEPMSAAAPIAATTTVTTSVTTPAPAQAETAVPAAAPAAVTTVETQPLMPVPQMPAAAPVVVQNSEVTEKMTAMEARLDALDAKLEQMQPSMAPANDERLNAIQATLSRLEGRLDDLSAKKSAPVRSASVSNDDVIDAPVKKTVTKKAKPKKTTPPADAQWDGAYTPPASRPAPALNGGGWQLRGAKPGSAIIAKGNDIREVMVGDSVPGLGQIGAVSNTSGRWMVQGTQGTLSQ